MFGKSAKACLKANPDLEKKGIKRGALGKRLKNSAAEKINKQMVLTPKEESDLVDWLISSNLARDGKDNSQIADKVVEISKAAARIIKGGTLSKHWFARFYSTHRARLAFKVPQPMDKKRAAVSNDESVDEHFEGEFGLRVELQDAYRKDGDPDFWTDKPIMDENGKITDARRIMNRDECGQFVDYNRAECVLASWLPPPLQKRQLPRLLPAIRLRSTLIHVWTMMGLSSPHRRLSMGRMNTSEHNNKDKTRC